MVNVNSAVSGAVVTLVAFIMSVVSMFVGFLFLPLLNSSAFITTDARNLLQTVYPILMILIPLFVLIGGITVTAYISAKAYR